MTKRIIFAFIIAYLVGSCSTATSSPTHSPTATALPTITFSPAPSATPTITPFPPLQTQGPYIVFTRDNKNLTIMDADGGGRQQIKLPDNGYIIQLNKAVSPDGKWLAYFIGSREASYDMTLNLLNLSDETTQPVSKLLASDFPENLEPIVETMVLGDPPSYDPDCFQDMECRRSLVERELTNSLFAFDWSPDDNFVAFTAQIDGPSSDVYIYNTQQKTIRRLTTEPQNIYSLDWAPNGHAILYQISSPPGTSYEGSEWHLMNLAGKQILFTEELSSRYSRFDGYEWITESLYLFLAFSDVDPAFSHFKVLNTDTGQVKEVWPYTADFFAMNRDNKTILLIHKNRPTQKATVPEGIYMVYPSGKYWRISDLGIQFVITEGQKPYPIFSQDYNGQIYSIDNDGSIHMLPWLNDKIPWISPDGNLLLFKEERKLALSDNSYRPIKSWQMEDDYYSLNWRPDSLGVFIFTDKNIYSLAISDEQPRVVEICPLERCEPVRFVWLP
jgi:dipeptidyl aminopeptidase/acylaminoacyl peptidase